MSKELSRNCGKSGYRPKEADRLSRLRFRAKRPRGKVVAGEVRTEVEARLHIKHSTEQISGKLAKGCESVRSLCAARVPHIGNAGGAGRRKLPCILAVDQKISVTQHGPLFLTAARVTVAGGQGMDPR